MKKLLVVFLALLANACTTSPPGSTSIDSSSAAPEASAPAAAAPVASHSSATHLDAYKVDLAQRISQANAARVYPGRPQALLRSVVVVRYSVDRNGNLVHSEILRSNRDRATESIALASLKSAAPFPRPASQLLRHGKVDVAESWLFNNDGRFQLRSIAQAQMTE